MVFLPIWSFIVIVLLASVGTYYTVDGVQVGIHRLTKKKARTVHERYAEAVRWGNFQGSFESFQKKSSKTL